MAYIKFYRGTRANYDGTAQKDGVYFAYDTGEILMNGVVYGYSASEHKEIEAVDYTAPDTITITYSNGTSDSVVLQTASAGASAAESKGGLISTNDIYSLSKAQENVIEEIDLNGTALAVTDKKVNIDLSEYENTSYSGEGAIAVSDGSDEKSKTIALAIDSSDKVLSQSTGGLKTTLKLSYNFDDKLIELQGIDDAVIASIDATEFVQDGMISSVELVHENDKGESGEFIKITWNTDEGGDVIYLDVSELIDVYTAGNGIEVNDHEISVKLADSTESFLEVTEAGLRLSGVQDAINNAVAAASAAATTSVEIAAGAEHITISTSTSSDGHTAYTIGESNIASASALNSLSENVSANTESISALTESVNTNTEDISALAEALEWVEVE